MKFNFSIILIILISTSCSLTHYQPYVDIENKNIVVYRSNINNEKLHGNIIRRTTGLYDSTLNFTLKGSFKKGILNGNDSTFLNGELIEINNYRVGVKQGKQIELDDSVKSISLYVDGVIHGYQNTYVNNRLFKKSFYNHGVKDSLEYYYDSLENIVTTLEYHYNQDPNWLFSLRLDNYKLIYYSLSSEPSLELLKASKYKGTME
jgi:hypothetical protein